MKEIKTLLCTINFDNENFQKVKAMLPNAEIFLQPQRNELTLEDVMKADIIFGNVPMAYLEKAPNVGWIQLESAGFDEYLNMQRDDIVITTASGAYGEQISEFVIAGILALQKNMFFYYENQKETTWKKQPKISGITGSVCVVVGTGDIGSCIAKKMKALGAYVIGVRRSDMKKPEYCDEIYPTDQIDRLLPKADIVTLSLPNTSATHHIINRERLSLMKPSAIIANAGRGNAIDQDALSDALNKGIIGGAFLDVTTPEPLPSDNPLWKAKNVLITPHVSGTWELEPGVFYKFKKLIELFQENLDAWQSEKELKNAIDKNLVHTASTGGSRGGAERQ